MLFNEYPNMIKKNCINTYNNLLYRCTKIRNAMDNCTETVQS